MEFPENSFDAVMMVDVIEHLPADDGLDIIKNAEKWAKKKIIITTPNGYAFQNEVDNNPLQEHLSGWECEHMRELGFRVKGLAGLKCLRKGVHKDTMRGDLFDLIRFRPRPLWFAIATLSQTVVYFMPRSAFGLFCTKDTHDFLQKS